MTVRILNVHLFGSVGTKLTKVFDFTFIEVFNDLFDVPDADGEMRPAMVRVDFRVTVSNQMQFVAADRKPCSWKIKIRAWKFLELQYANVECEARFDVGNMDRNVVKLINIHLLFVAD